MSAKCYLYITWAVVVSNSSSDELAQLTNGFNYNQSKMSLNQLAYKFIDLY